MVNETILFDEMHPNDWKKAALAGDDLRKTIGSLNDELKAMFRGTSLADYFEEAGGASKALEKELLVMRLGFGRLRAAITDAFAPVTAVVVSAINDAIFAVIRFVRTIGKFIRAFMGIREGTEGAADAQDDYADSITSAAKAAKRSLASFDKLNRLQQSSGGSSASGTSGGYDYTMTVEEYMLFNKIAQWLKPLQEIDLTNLRLSLSRLYEAAKPLAKQLFEGLYWAWVNVLAPMISWTAESLLPVVIRILASVLKILSGVIERCKPVFTYLWENFLQPLGKWLGDTLILLLDELDWRLENIIFAVESFPTKGGSLLDWLKELAQRFVDTNPLLEKFRNIAGECVGKLEAFCTRLQNTLLCSDNLTSGIASLFVGVSSLSEVWDRVATAAKNAKDSLVNAWGNIAAWFRNQVLNPLTSGFKGTGNSILGIFSGVSSGATVGMNSLIRAINRMQFTIPDWIPNLGGKKFGFQLKELTAPAIPYLAKGAVLPANKPFLAVVGDQRHGTNVEAPLTTIQEAVRLELQDMIDSNIAGQEAVTGVLRQILEAVLGISITDGDIALAADRYHSRMAVVRGIY